jgi:hypothetical protein
VRADDYVRSQKQQIIEALLELSDKELQRRRWLSRGDGEVSSFSEAICQLFDDTGLGHELERGRVIFSFEMDELLRQFEASLKAAGSLDRKLSRDEFISHPDMAAIRAISTAILVQIVLDC